MKSLVSACALMLVLAATASAADLAVSKSTLSSMGLGGMQTMSDHDGTAVRGKGTFAGVWGGSTARWSVPTGPHSDPLIQESSNSYEAGAQWLGKGSSAGGRSLSFAGQVDVQFAAEGSTAPAYLAAALQVHIAGGVAGGGANAWAN